MHGDLIRLKSAAAVFCVAVLSGGGVNDCVHWRCVERVGCSRRHGGAIEDCERQLKAIADRAVRESISLGEGATRTLATIREAGEQSRERPMRRIDPVNHGYDGPPPRTISDTHSS